MGKINSFITQFAKPTPPKAGVEIGTSTTGLLPSIFNDEFIDTDKVKVTDYKKMLDSDGTIQALYNTIVMPILGSSWTIEADDPKNKAAVDQSAWVEDALRTPPHKGGMSTPFDLVLAQALRAVVEGYAGFEKVYEVAEGKIVYKKIAWRDPSTITMKTDDRGGFAGLRQRAFIGNQYSDVTIPLDRCFLYTYGKEFHNLKGRSAFMAAYVAYDKKRRLLYLAEQQAQNEAFKLKIVEGSERANQDELDATMASVDEVGVRATVAIPNGYKVSTLNDTAGLNLLPFIEFQNAEMARSVLAMFILLGTGSKTGSYSLSQDQSDFFIQALMSIRKSLENHITSYLIPDLYKFNFATPEYGTFKFEDITDSTVDLLKQTFIKLTEKDRLPQDVIDGVVQKMADKLEIDIDIMEQAVNGEGENNGTNQPEEQPVKPDDTPPVPPPVENSRRNLALPGTDGWRRDKTPAEEKVNFDGLNNKLGSLESETERAIKPVWDALVVDATLKIHNLIDAGDYDKITEKNVFDENLKNQYVKVLKEAGLEAYLYGKNGASDELEVKSPPTPKESKDFFRDNAVAIVEKQLSDLIFKIQMEVSKARRKDQLSRTEFATGDVVAAINDIFFSYYEDNISLTGFTTVSVGVNKGRKDVFEANKQDIYAYQYSALLDSTTCPTCEALDGKVLDEASYKRTEYDPPIHHNCRCIWVAIMADELDPPPITGFPEDGAITDTLDGKPVRLLEPSLSKVQQEQIVELGRRAVQDEVDRLLAED